MASAPLPASFADLAACGHGTSAGTQLRDPALALVFDGKLVRRCGPSHPTRVELESSVDHDNGPWMIAGLIADVSQRLGTSDKEAAAEAALISNDPVATAILTDHEGWWPQTRRRFAFGFFLHNIFPIDLTSFASS
jgi:hypothetical protein